MRRERYLLPLQRISSLLHATLYSFERELCRHCSELPRIMRTFSSEADLYTTKKLTKRRVTVARPMTTSDAKDRIEAGPAAQLFRNILSSSGVLEELMDSDKYRLYGTLKGKDE